MKYLNNLNSTQVKQTERHVNVHAAECAASAIQRSRETERWSVCRMLSWRSVVW